MAKRICEDCGAEYPHESSDMVCSARYPDLFDPGLDTPCGGKILPPPGQAQETHP